MARRDTRKPRAAVAAMPPMPRIPVLRAMVCLPSSASGGTVGVSTARGSTVTPSKSQRRAAKFWNTGGINRKISRIISAYDPKNRLRRLANRVHSSDRSATRHCDGSAPTGQRETTVMGASSENNQRPRRRRYVPVIGPRLNRLLAVVFATFALMTVNAVYLVSVTVAGVTNWSPSGRSKNSSTSTPPTATTATTQTGSHRCSPRTDVGS